MPFIDIPTESLALLERLLNRKGIAEGTSLPPKLRGSARVPSVRNPAVSITQDAFGGNVFAISWIDPELARNVSHYNIYVRNPFNNDSPTLMGSSSTSPCFVKVETNQTANQPLTFFIQTVLHNGLSMPILESPTVTASIDPAAISPENLNTSLLFVDGLVLTDNSPAAGRIAWSTCTVYYQGSSYSISSGNTASSSIIFVTWTVGATTFGSGATFTPADNIFLIATNNNGTADVAWNKLANLGVQRTNLSFGLLEGYDIQPLATASTSLAGDSDAVVNESVEGALLSIACLVTGTPTGSPDFRVEVTVDGATTSNYNVMDAGVFTDEAKAEAMKYTGTGGTIGDLWTIYIGVTYRTSLLVTANNNVAGSGGSIATYVRRAHKV